MDQLEVQQTTDDSSGEFEVCAAVFCSDKKPPSLCMVSPPLSAVIPPVGSLQDHISSPPQAPDIVPQGSDMAMQDTDKTVCMYVEYSLSCGLSGLNYTSAHALRLIFERGQCHKRQSSRLAPKYRFIMVNFATETMAIRN